MTNTTGTNNSENNSTDLEELKQQMLYSKLIVGGIIAIVLILYFSNFHVSVSTENGDWGTFGDFIGGILNPIIASFALYWLITSVNLQIQELKKTNDALAKTVETAEKQQNQVSIQNFENLLFQLMKAKNESLEKIQHRYLNEDAHGNITEEKISQSVDAIKNHIIEFKNNFYNGWGDYYKNKMMDNTASYFGICYHLIDIIETNESFHSSSEDENQKIILKNKQKLYFDIFKSTLTKHELEAFFFNFISEYGNKTLKKNIEKYYFFENLPIDHDRSNEKNHRLTRYAYQYDSIIFKENSYWKNYYNEISKIDIEISVEELQSTFEKLHSISIINYSIIHRLVPKRFENTSGFCYQFNGNINSKDIFNIFSEENINSIKNSPLYTKLEFQINQREQIIENINQSIKKCISYFNNHCIENYNDKFAPIAEFSGDNKSINQLNKIKEEQNNNINIYKKQIEDLDQQLISIQKSNSSLTVFILIKYGISFTEYTEYMKSKQVLNEMALQ